MDAWTRTLRAVAMVPAVVVSTVAWLIGAALLPAGLGGLVLLVAPVVLVVLWLGRSGRVGRLVDQLGALLAGAREPTVDEVAVLQPVLSRLVELKVDSMQLLISRSARPYPPVRPFGRDQVVVSPVLVEAVFRRQLGVEDAVALIVHNIGWLRAQPTRGAVALAAWTLPWRVVSAVISHAGAAARWLPLVVFAWRLRLVVGTVAVIQSAVEGRTTSAVLVAVILAATYTTPAACRARGARLQAAADDYVSARGLGPTLLGAAHRVGAPQPGIARTRRLQAGADPTGGRVLLVVAVVVPGGDPRGRHVDAPAATTGVGPRVHARQAAQVVMADPPRT